MIQTEASMVCADASFCGKRRGTVGTPICICVHVRKETGRITRELTAGRGLD